MTFSQSLAARNDGRADFLEVGAGLGSLRGVPSGASFPALSILSSTLSRMNEVGDVTYRPGVDVLFFLPFPRRSPNRPSTSRWSLLGASPRSSATLTTRRRWSASRVRCWSGFGAFRVAFSVFSFVVPSEESTDRDVSCNDSYTAFYILYPVGAGSEAVLIALSAPYVSFPPSFSISASPNPAFNPQLCQGEVRYSRRTRRLRLRLDLASRYALFLFPRPCSS